MPYARPLHSYRTSNIRYTQISTPFCANLTVPHLHEFITDSTALLIHQSTYILVPCIKFPFASLNPFIVNKALKPKKSQICIPYSAYLKTTHLYHFESNSFVLLIHWSMYIEVPCIKVPSAFPDSFIVNETFKLTKSLNLLPLLSLLHCLLALSICIVFFYISDKVIPVLSGTFDFICMTLATLLLSQHAIQNPKILKFLLLLEHISPPHISINSHPIPLYL